MANTWAPSAPGARFGLYQGPASPATTDLNSVATPSEGAEAAAQPWNPENPLFWFGVLAAATFGLMAVSTTVRVGGAKASVSLGDTK